MTELDELATLIVEGDRRRADRARTAFRTLRRFERRIAREAAVMGYVLGRQDGQLDLAMPPDMAILQDVIEHCDTTGDLYPFLAAACDGRRRRVTRARLFDFEREEQR